VGVDAAVSATVKEARVVELLPRLTWRVEIDGGARVLAHATGEGARNFVRIRPGDRVAVELSPHDPGRGRIVRLLKG
jgi:translation initiation factor IF-1